MPPSERRDAYRVSTGSFLRPLRKRCLSFPGLWETATLRAREKEGDWHSALRLWQHRAGTVLDGIYSLDSHAAGIHVCIDHRRNAALHEMVDADSIRGGTSTCMCAAHHASRLGNRGIASALACLAHWPLGAKHFVP